jgi:hypothetical protein
MVTKATCHGPDVEVTNLQAAMNAATEDLQAAARVAARDGGGAKATDVSEVGVDVTQAGHIVIGVGIHIHDTITDFEIRHRLRLLNHDCCA